MPVPVNAVSNQSDTPSPGSVRADEINTKSRYARAAIAKLCGAIKFRHHCRLISHQSLLLLTFYSLAFDAARACVYFLSLLLAHDVRIQRCQCKQSL